MNRVFYVSFNLLKNITTSSNTSSFLSEKWILILIILIVVIIVLVIIIGGKIKVKNLEIESDGINKYILSMIEWKKLNESKNNKKGKNKKNN